MSNHQSPDGCRNRAENQPYKEKATTRGRATQGSPRPEFLAEFVSSSIHRTQGRSSAAPILDTNFGRSTKSGTVQPHYGHRTPITRATRSAENHRTRAGGIGNPDGAILAIQVLKTWAKQEALIARSSAEAELYAIVNAATETIGTQALASDLGMTLSARVYIDSNAAKSIGEREGFDWV